MLNPIDFISKFIRSHNQNELNRIAKIVEKINSLEKNIKKLGDHEFPQKTADFKQKLKEGKKIDEILPEA